MARRLFIFEEPDRFLAVARGEPGKRAFFLQAGQGRAVVTLGVEKMQVAALADRISAVVAAIGEPAGGAEASDRPALVDEAVEPMVELFRVGALALGWDPDTKSVLVEARPVNEEGEYPEVTDDDPNADDLLRVRLSAPQALEFATAAAAVVVAGRTPCPFCGQPLDPSGHFCTRSNGQLN
jgi:uncharacterized repeat protein (TIGR03847 family)